MSEIMIIDDTVSGRYIISALLKEEGHEVIEAVDGKDALEKINPSVKMIITDLNMPRMDGLELVKILRENPDYKAIPVIMVSSESDEGIKAEGRVACVTEWIDKPVTGRKVIEVVKRFLTKSYA
ncbi:MAG: response regulator [Candidatus Eremiobacterota bacterium]